MPILKEGIILKNELLFKQTEKNYYCALCYGTWNPASSASELIFESEATETRFSPTISTGWDDDLGVDFVNINLQVNYPTDILYNRIVLYYGGLQRSLYDVNFNGFNSLTISLPEINDFSIGDRIIYNSNFYEISAINGLEIGVIPFLNSPNLPNSGSGQIRDASGIPIIGNVFDDIYLIKNNTTVNFSINGRSI